MTLFRHHTGDHATAEDLAQEVFLRVYRRGYQPTAKFTTWIHTIANNVASDLRQRAYRRTERGVPPTVGLLERDRPRPDRRGRQRTLPARLADRTELQAVVRDAIAALNDGSGWRCCWRSSSTAPTRRSPRRWALRAGGEVAPLPGPRPAPRALGPYEREGARMSDPCDAPPAGRRRPRCSGRVWDLLDALPARPPPRMTATTRGDGRGRGRGRRGPVVAVGWLAPAAVVARVRHRHGRGPGHLDRPRPVRPRLPARSSTTTSLREAGSVNFSRRSPARLSAAAAAAVRR